MQENLLPDKILTRGKSMPSVRIWNLGWSSRKFLRFYLYVYLVKIMVVILMNSHPESRLMHLANSLGSPWDCI